MRIRKELWFGFTLMALIGAAALTMVFSVDTMTNGHYGLQKAKRHSPRRRA